MHLTDILALWAWNTTMGLLGLPVVISIAALMRWIDNR